MRGRITLDTLVYVADEAFRDYGAVAARRGFGTKGRGVEICIVDTGIDPGHEQLNTRIVAWADFVSPEWKHTKPFDDHGHGTHVASIAAGDGRGSPGAARYRGVAPKAKLSVAKVLNAEGSGSIEQVIQGVEWCAARESADVISMSLGTRVPSDGTDPLSVAVNRAAAAGKVVVVAAGNIGPTPGVMGSPAAASEAITVGAAAEWSGDSMGPWLAPWSSRGPTRGGVMKPDIVAPGVTITAATAGTVNGYHAWSGTSMATPYIAGTAALMLSANPLLFTSDIKAILGNTGLDLGPPGQDGDWGWGLVNTHTAVAAVLGEPGRDIFPPHVTFEVSYKAGRNWSGFIEVLDIAAPIAASIIVQAPGLSEGESNPTVILKAPDGDVIAWSQCPNDQPCGTGASGRQETISVMPTVEGGCPILDRGQYVLGVHPDGFSNPIDTDAVTVMIDLFNARPAYAC